MNAVEKMVRVLSAVNALSELKDARIEVTPDSEADFMDLAKLLDATVRGHSVLYVDTPSLGAVWLYSFDVVHNGVTIHAQGTRPATMAEIATASVCDHRQTTEKERKAALAKMARRAKAKCEHCLGSKRVWSKITEGYEPCPACNGTGAVGKAA